MSFSIKNKLEKLINFNLHGGFKKKYKYLFSRRKHLFLFLIGTIIPISSYFYFDLDPVTNLIIHSGVPIHGFNIFYIFTSITIEASLFVYLILHLRIYDVTKSNWFSLQKEMLNVEKEIDAEFGSVDNLIAFYNKGKKLNIELSDLDFYNLKNEQPLSKNKMEYIDEKTEIRIKKIDERMAKLIKEKEEVLSRAKNKKTEVFNKNSLQIEYKSADISISASELKDRVLSTVGSLK